VRSLGALPVLADALDRDAVGGAVVSAEPEVIVHQLTAAVWADVRAGHAAPRSLPHGDHRQPAADRGDGPPAAVGRTVASAIDVPASS